MTEYKQNKGVDCKNEDENNKIVHSNIILSAIRKLQQITENKITTPFLLDGANIQEDFVIDGNFDKVLLIFQNCTFTNTVSFQNSVINGLVFQASKFQKMIFFYSSSILNNLFIGDSKFLEKSAISIEASGVKIGGNVVLENLQSSTIDFFGASIEGGFACIGGNISNPSGITINFKNANIKKNLALNNFNDGNKIIPFESIGELNLQDANIDGLLISNGGRFLNIQGDSINAQRARIKGGVFLRNGFKSSGLLDFYGTKIDGSVEFDGAVFEKGKTNDVSFNASNASINGSLSFSTWNENKRKIPFKSIGEIRLEDAEVNGILTSDGGQFINTQGRSMNAQRARIKGGIFLRNGFKSVGLLDFYGTKIDGSIVFDGAVFEKGKTNDVSFNASTASINGGLSFSSWNENTREVPFKSIGEIRLEDTEINGLLLSNGGQLSNTQGRSINAQRARIKGGAFLRNGFKSVGLLDFYGAKIDGSVLFDGAIFENGKGNNISFDVSTASINGGLSFSTWNDNNKEVPFKSIGEIRLVDAEINGILTSNGGQFINTQGKSMTAQRARIKGGVFLRNGFKSVGLLDFYGTKIDGSVLFDGAVFENGKGNNISFDASTASINGGLSFSIWNDKNKEIPFKSIGEIRLVDTEINGILKSNGSQFDNPYGFAIKALRLKVTNAIFNNGFITHGQVDFSNAFFKGDFIGFSGEFTNGNGPALVLYGSTINGDLRLFDQNNSKAKTITNYLLTNGSVNLSKVHILGHLILNNARFNGHKNDAMIANSISVEGDARIQNAYLGGNVNFSNATINGSLKYLDIVLPQKSILNLSHAKIGILEDDKKSWPDKGNLNIEGLEYGGISNTRQISSIDRIDWIRRQYKEGNSKEAKSTKTNLLNRKFSTQPYEYLASFYKKNGFETEFKEIEIAKNDDLLKFKTTNIFEYIITYVFKLFRYGYSLQRVILTMSLFIFLGSVFFKTAFKSGIIVPLDQNKKIKQYFAFHPIVYSLNLFIPIVKLIPDIQWYLDPKRIGRVIIFRRSIKLKGSYFRAYSLFHSVAGWISVTIFVSGISRFLK